MRVTRALSLPLTAAMVALALAGCMQTGSEVAMAPRNDLDAMAYGQTGPYPIASTDSGGAISAMRASYAASPRTDLRGNADRKQPGASRQCICRSPRRHP